MNKKYVIIVVQKMLNCLAKLNKIKDVFAVKNVTKLLFGKIFVTRDVGNNIGLNYGLKKATASDSCANYPVTVISKSKVLKITGCYLLHQKKILITLNSNI